MSTQKKILLAICFVISLCTFAQKVSKLTMAKPAVAKAVSANQNMNLLMDKVDSVVKVTNMWLKQIELDNSLKNRYKLYQTENLYTFLQLDTKTGQIEQIQWSLDSNNEGSLTLNGDDLTDGYGLNSFELYPTKNLYQFILLNKTTGQKWHVQWGMEVNSRWIRRIY